MRMDAVVRVATALIVVALGGCVALGVGQVAPGASTAVHYSTTYYYAYSVPGRGSSTERTDYYYRTSEGHRAGPLGMLVGYQGGVATVSLPGASSTTGYTGELYMDVMTHGLGLKGSWGSEGATANGVSYHYGGVALGAFAQMHLRPSVYLNLGLTRISGNVSNDNSLSSFDADAWRISAQLMFAVENFGGAIELRSTTSDHAVLDNVDVTWSSISMVFEVFYVGL